MPEQLAFPYQPQTADVTLEQHNLAEQEGL